MELHEIEELMKSINRHAIKALLRNAVILKDPKASKEMKEQAAANVKAISSNGQSRRLKDPKQPVIPAAAPEQATQLVQQPAQQTPVAAAPSSVAPVQSKNALPYHPDYAQYGINEQQWHSAPPEAHHELVAHHASQTTTPKVVKSIDALYNLFTELKKRL